MIGGSLQRELLTPVGLGSWAEDPSILRTTDAAMPYPATVWHAFSAPKVRGAITFGPASSVFDSVVDACLDTLRWAAVGCVIGVVVGLLALLMDRLVVAERALLPYVVLSQTAPLIALAPLVTKWGQDSSIGSL